MIFKNIPQEAGLRDKNNYMKFISRLIEILDTKTVRPFAHLFCKLFYYES